MRGFVVLLAVVLACSPRTQLSDWQAALDGGGGELDVGGEPGGDAGSGSDAGTGSDAGADAGMGSDGGTGSDAGADAGTGSDGGTGSDAGADAGTGSDGGTGADAGADAGADGGIDAPVDASNDGLSPPRDGQVGGGNNFDNTSFYACNSASGTPAMWLPLVGALIVLRRRRAR